MFTSLFPTCFLVASHAVECGLTIPGLRYVVDSGWTEFVHTDVAAGMDVRTVAPVSQASMVQVRVCILNKCNFIVYSRRSLRHPLFDRRRTSLTFHSSFAFCLYSEQGVSVENAQESAIVFTPKTSCIRTCRSPTCVSAARPPLCSNTISLRCSALISRR